MSQGCRVLLLPGWQDSGPDHWQGRWAALHGDRRVEQADWERPLRGDWMVQLEEAVRAEPTPVVLVAHSLGCHLVAAWAAHSGLAVRVRGALLVAPPDTTQADFPPVLHSWRQAVRQPLPFPAVLVCSSDDPYAAPAAARDLAAAWGATLVEAGPRGHLNTASGLGDWPEGRALIAPWLDR